MSDIPIESAARLLIDHTHMARRATGIERITRELFSAAALPSLPVECVRAPAGRSGVAIAQNVTMPLRALRRRDDIFVFPGFPPSPYFSITRRDRTILYVHDVFLLTRRNELNLAAKYYFAPLFRLAVRSLKYFLVNSQYTASNLQKFCRPDARVMLCRPTVRNVFGLDVGDRAARTEESGVLRIAAIGTIEPRKNLRAAASICSALSGRLGISVHLHVVGRTGWGDDAAWLSQQPHVTLHGPLHDQEARAVIEASDLLICTSRDEGLGLPLLEVQHAGLPVIAPDQPVFREVLGNSGLLIDTENPERAAETVASALAAPDWRGSSAKRAIANVMRWNELARTDQADVTAFLEQMLLGTSARG